LRRLWESRLGNGTVLPKKLPVHRIPRATQLLRIHGRKRKPLWFGPAGGIALHRFDDPNGEFGVCYFGMTVEVCFAETFLRNPPVGILSLDDLSVRLVTTVESVRDLRLVSLHGAGLGRLGTTNQPASGGDYALSQRWSRALWEHDDRVDGIAYRGRHDDSSLCAAIYNRAKSGLKVADSRALTEDPALLARMLKRYDLGLTR
jgi:hypothetical protein